MLHHRSLRDVSAALADVPIRDPLARRQAPLLQILLVLLLLFALLRLPLTLRADLQILGRLPAALHHSLVLLTPLGALGLLRRGAFATAVLLSAACTLLALAVPLSAA
ncbi:MAG: hypothetical protein HGA45_39270, partial [Chloroflexales bacterium]|nr:hypothetical protein [Chloroflexales bacterium]